MCKSTPRIHSCSYSKTLPFARWTFVVEMKRLVAENNLQSGTANSALIMYGP